MHILSADPSYIRACDDRLWQIIDEPKFVMTYDNFEYKIYAKQIKVCSGLQEMPLDFVRFGLTIWLMPLF